MGISQSGDFEKLSIQDVYSLELKAQPPKWGFPKVGILGSWASWASWASSAPGPPGPPPPSWASSALLGLLGLLGLLRPGLLGLLVRASWAYTARFQPIAASCSS